MLVARSLSRVNSEVSAHGRARPPLLSVGTDRAGNRAVALRETAAGGVLAVDHHFRGSAGSGGVRFRGNDTRPGVVERDISGIRKTVADSGAGDADSGQSFGGEPGGVGGIVF